MTQRVRNYYNLAPASIKAMMALEQSFADSSIEETIQHLVKLRASQINGCAFCIHMHATDLRRMGESEMRLYMLDAWHESSLYSPRERAALAWTEVLTRLPEHGVPDELYARVREQFQEKELSDLTYIIIEINGWNRANVAFQTVPGSSDKAFGLDKANLS